MLAEDFQRFETAIRKLEDIYSKKITDDAVRAFWLALKDLPFQQVSERIDAHIRYAKFFPKPVELRPKEERPKEKDATFDAAFREAERLANERLEGLRVSDPQEWLRQVSPKVYEMGRARGMPDGLIDHKLQEALRKGVCVGSSAH